MSIYYRISNPDDRRELSDQHAAWLAANNPKANEWALLPAKPTHNPASQHPPVFRDGAWVIVDLTQPELDARAEQAAQEQEESQIRQVYQALKDATGTQAERLRRVELATAALIRRVLGR